jgi:hypothetical protein
MNFGTMDRDQLLAQLAEQEKRETSPAILAGTSSNLFDARNEVSADAKYVAGKIVRHLWTIFVLLPVVLGILYAVVSSK